MKNDSTHKRFIKSRVIVAILASIGCTLLIVLRTNLSVAIIAMVDEKDVIENYQQIEDKDLCYDINTAINKSHSQTEFKGKYLWSQSVQGIILGSYFYGFSATQFLGYFADKFGAKWMIAFGIFMPSVCNLLIPVLADIHYSLIIAMRVMIGAFHGVVFSCLFSMISKWFPQSEQNLAITGLIFASNLGGVLTMPLAGYLCKTDLFGGWPSVFYLTSLIHVIWFYLWYEFVYNSPEEDRSITQSELQYILRNNKNSKNVRNLTIPWKSILTSRPVWASVVTKMSCSFGYYLLCTKMPTYLDTVFGLEIYTNSWFNSLLYAVLCCSTLSAGHLSNFSCAVCLALIPLFECDTDAVIALLLIQMLFFGSISGGEFAVIPEYAPNYSGTVFGLTNTLASTTGFMGPQIVGFLLDYGDGAGVRQQWNIIWYITAIVYTFGGIVFELLGTAEPQHWALITTDGNKQETDILKEQII